MFVWLSPLNSIHTPKACFTNRPNVIDLLLAGYICNLSSTGRYLKKCYALFIITHTALVIRQAIYMHTTVACMVHFVTGFHCDFIFVVFAVNLNCLEHFIIEESFITRSLPGRTMVMKSGSYQGQSENTCTGIETSAIKTNLLLWLGTRTDDDIQHTR